MALAKKIKRKNTIPHKRSVPRLSDTHTSIGRITMTRDVPVIQSDLTKSVHKVITDTTKIPITREEVLAWEAT